MATVETRPTLSDAEHVELVTLIEGADSVELKLTVPGTRSSAPRSTSLGMDPLDAQIRQVFFFDTPDLTLNKRGVVVRARRVQRKGDDSVVKLRPVVPTELPGTVRKSPELRRRGRRDARRLRLLGVDEACARDAGRQGRRPGRAPDPEALLQGAAGVLRRARARRASTLDDLTVLGPIFVLKLKFTPEGLRPQARGRALALP